MESADDVQPDDVQSKYGIGDRVMICQTGTASETTTTTPLLLKGSIVSRELRLIPVLLENATSKTTSPHQGHWEAYYQVHLLERSEALPCHKKTGEKQTRSPPSPSPKTVAPPNLTTWVSESAIVRHFPAHLLKNRTTFKFADALRYLWKDLVFRRVNRTIAKAQDMSIWWRDVDNPANNHLIGDNKDELRRYSREDKQNYISIEYDYFYGFTKEFALHPSDPHANESIHFASDRYEQVDLTVKGTGDWGPAYIVHPLRSGQLMCGVPQRTARGISFKRWWQCPEEFYRLWKLVMDGNEHSIGDNLKRLGTDDNHVFQAVAVAAVYEKGIPAGLLESLPRINDVPFIEELYKQVMWMWT